MDTSLSYMTLGSCFSIEVAKLMQQDGCEVVVNPFGTLFNPCSIRDSLQRLAHPRPFTEEDCVMMGAGADLWCDFHHYTRFARATQTEFLENANRTLQEAAQSYARAKVLILTFGTAWCFRYLPPDHPMSGRVVANCLKRPAAEFSRERLTVDEIVSLYTDFVQTGGCLGNTDVCPKEIIFTVSPVRHPADGLQGNMASKSILMLSCEKLTQIGPARYFPSFEIMMEQLRGTDAYAADGRHPSDASVRFIYQRFQEFMGGSLSF